MNKDLISQLESSYDFLHHQYMTERDPKLVEEIKKELFECMEQLRRARDEV